MNDEVTPLEPSTTEGQKQLQTKHVMEVALANLQVVIDQIASLDNDAVKPTLNYLIQARTALETELEA